jgi:hypothetical protein
VDEWILTVNSIESRHVSGLIVIPVHYGLFKFVQQNEEGNAVSSSKIVSTIDMLFKAIDKLLARPGHSVLSKWAKKKVNRAAGLREPANAQFL